MNLPKPHTASLLLLAALAGCKTTEGPQPGPDGEIAMPTMQQNTYLSHSKQPQFFGFEAYRTEDGIGCRGAARLHANHLAVVDFVKGNVPVISVQGKAARTKAKILVDTSSPTSWLEFKTSQEFDATFLGIGEKNIPYRGGYNTGGVPGYAAVVRQMRIKQLFIEDIPLYVRMAINSLGPLARGIEKPKVEGVFGYDILSNFEYVQFDFKSEAMALSSSIPFVPRESLLMTEARIVNVPNAGLAVEGAIFGENTPIVLDTAGDYHFARGDAKVNVTKQVSIGEVVYRKVPTLLLPPSGLPPRAGRKMLEPYIVTVCPKLGVVYFERQPE
jgi:hypothetical protein